MDTGLKNRNTGKTKSAVDIKRVNGTNFNVCHTQQLRENLFAKCTKCATIARNVTNSSASSSTVVD